MIPQFFSPSSRQHFLVLGAQVFQVSEASAVLEPIGSLPGDAVALTPSGSVPAPMVKELACPVCMGWGSRSLREGEPVPCEPCLETGLRRVQELVAEHWGMRLRAEGLVSARHDDAPAQNYKNAARYILGEPSL